MNCFQKLITKASSNAFFFFNSFMFFTAVVYQIKKGVNFVIKTYRSWTRERALESCFESCKIQLTDISLFQLFVEVLNQCVDCILLSR